LPPPAVNKILNLNGKCLNNYCRNSKRKKSESSKYKEETMKLFAEKIFALVLPLAVLLISSNVLAHEESKVNQPADARPELSLTVPDLADIIPLAAKLSGRLADLENKVKGGPDISALGRKFTGVESNLKGPAGQLQQLKDSRDRRYTKLVELKEEIELEKESFEDITKPLNEAIRQLGAWRSEWLAEKQRWNQWQSVLLKEGALDRLEAAFAKTDVTIETISNLAGTGLKSKESACEPPPSRLSTMPM
jgi:hypothetical protein